LTYTAAAAPSGVGSLIGNYNSPSLEKTTPVVGKHADGVGGIGDNNACSNPEPWE